MAKKPKSYTLIRGIDAVFARDDDTIATFHPEDVGATYDDSDVAVRKALSMFPDSFHEVS